MARRTRAADIAAHVGSWMPETSPAGVDDDDGALHGPAAGDVSLYRRAALPDVLVIMVQDGRAWECPDRAGGWTARRELRRVAARGLTRLADADERRAVARLAIAAADLSPAMSEPAAAALAPTAAEPGALLGDAGPPPGPVTPTTAAPTHGRRVAVSTYLDPSEADALAARALADDRPVAYIVRAAVRAYLGLP